MNRKSEKLAPVMYAWVALGIVAVGLHLVTVKVEHWATGGSKVIQPRHAPQTPAAGSPIN
jgi:hypothetical protein